MKLILASRSPRRHDILHLMGIPFETDVCMEPEVCPSDLSPSETVQTLAYQKASNVLKRHPDDYVLGADTIVVLNGDILGKPHSMEQATEYLHRLQGRSHTVLTGVALLHNDQADVRFCKTEVTFRSLTDAEIDRYVATGEPMDKAGAYGVQGRACILVDRIDGNYFNVIGLPAPMVYEMLDENGFFLSGNTEQ